MLIYRASIFTGSCYKVAEDPRRVFVRILGLYSPTYRWNSKENDKGGGRGTSQLADELLANMGKVTYPLYDTIR